MVLLIPFLSHVLRIFRTYMLNHFHLSWDKLKLFRFIIINTVQRTSTRITDFIFIRNIVDDNLTRQVFRQRFALRLITSFLLWQRIFSCQLFRLIIQLALTGMAFGTFAKRLLLRNTELLLEILITRYHLRQHFFNVARSSGCSGQQKLPR